MRLDPFYLIVDSAEWIERLVPLGVKLVQLRIKDMPDRELRRHVRRAQVLCRAHGCQLIVNDYWQLAIDENCDFIHLGQEDLAEADLGAIRRAGCGLASRPMIRPSFRRLLAQNRITWRWGRSGRRS